MPFWRPASALSPLRCASAALSHERHFQTYHRVLNRARWSSLQASRSLLSVLIKNFAPTGALVFAIDDTIERRRGGQIKATGIYRDAVRSSHSHFVKASGLRWLCLMLTVRIPWAERVWALPVLTCLCPSARYYEERGHAHKKLTAWARQMLLQVKRWLPEREMVVVADSSFAALELLAALRREMTVITRLRLDAALYEPAPMRQPRQHGRPRLKGVRLPTLATVLKDAQTVWSQHTVGGCYGRQRARGGSGFRSGRVVSHRNAAGSRPLGVGQRPSGGVQAASLALDQP